jgi:hypothetical protein
VYFQDPERLAFQRGVAYAELGRHVDAVPLLATALEGLADGYERDRARYAAQLALALAGAGEADAALVQAVYGAELAARTGSALATRQLRRVRDALRDSGAEKQAQALGAAVVRTVLPPSRRTCGRDSRGGRSHRSPRKR